MNIKIVTTISALTLFIVVGATTQVRRSHKNLKILPKDISDEKLDSIMKSYNVALGVDCKFCHIPFPNKPDSLDYASDADPMKENARKMMEMNIELNKKWFYFDKNERPEYLKTVTCKTCHRGEPFPEQH